MKLSQQQLDALKEVGNIGCGNAASALAEFLNRRIHMAVPSAEIVSLQQISDKVGEQDNRVVSVLLKLMGSISGNFLFIISEQTSVKIVKRLIPQSNISSLFKLDELESSCLMEICNILGGAFSNALSILTKTSIINSLPVLSLDTVDKIINSITADTKNISNEVLMIETSFIEEQDSLKIHIFLLPLSLEHLFQKIGVNGDD